MDDGCVTDGGALKPGMVEGSLCGEAFGWIELQQRSDERNGLGGNSVPLLGRKLAITVTYPITTLLFGSSVKR